LVLKKGEEVKKTITCVDYGSYKNNSGVAYYSERKEPITCGLWSKRNYETHKDGEQTLTSFNTVSNIPSRGERENEHPFIQGKNE